MKLAKTYRKLYRENENRQRFLKHIMVKFYSKSGVKINYASLSLHSEGKLEDARK